MHSINGVEIFRTGLWRNKIYTESDLQDMVDTFEEFKNNWFRPAIKDGHHQEKGKPALGYITGLRRVGSKLVADLQDMPKTVYDAIRERRYDRVSVEIVPKIERHGKVYKNVLWALALLGVEVPEVDGLKPLREVVGFECGPEFEIENFEEDTVTTNMSVQEAGQKIDKLARTYMFEHPEMDYERAFHAVLVQYPDLKEAYSMDIKPE